MKKKRTKLILSCSLLLLFILIPSLSIYAGGGKALRMKLNQCNDEKARLQGEIDGLKSENTAFSNQISSLNADKATLQSRINDLEQQIGQKDQEIADLKDQLAQAPNPTIVSKTVQEVQQKEAEIIDLKSERDELQSEVRSLNSQIDQLNRQSSQLNRQIAQLQSDNSAMMKENDDLNQQIKSLSSQNQTLQNKNDELYNALEVYEGIQKESIQLMDLVYARLLEELSNEIKQGKVRVYKAALGVVVDISSKYVFDTGSVVVNPEGKAIIQKIGRLLPNLSGNYLIGVLGNADSQPIVTPALKKRFPTNWELSAARGATVVRYLIDVSRLSPSRFISMGLGEYQPITTNATVQGRGKNRRIDIVLLPVDVLSAVVVGAEVQ